MDTVPTSVVECSLLDGAPPQLGDGGAWCDAHNKCDHCAKDVVDAAREEIRHLKAERDRALAELDKALGEREDAMLSERNAAFNAGYDEGFASADDWYAEHAAELAEHGWVRLPKDADGETWTGSERVFATDAGTRYDMRHLMYDGKRWLIDSSFGGFDALLVHHHHAPTVEDVLWQFLGECESAANLGYDEVPQEVFDDYAAKLRLAGDE